MPHLKKKVTTKTYIRQIRHNEFIFLIIRSSGGCTIRLRSCHFWPAWREPYSGFWHSV